MGLLCELEAQHGVQLGTGYKNNQACCEFVKYIAQEQRDLLISMVRFFGIQFDGNTDSANIEEELFLVLFFDPYQKGACSKQILHCPSAKKL